MDHKAEHDWNTNGHRTWTPKFQYPERQFLPEDVEESEYDESLDAFAHHSEWDAPSWNTQADDFADYDAGWAQDMPSHETYGYTAYETYAPRPPHYAPPLDVSRQVPYSDWISSSPADRFEQAQPDIYCQRRRDIARIARAEHRAWRGLTESDRGRLGALVRYWSAAGRNAQEAQNQQTLFVGEIPQILTEMIGHHSGANGWLHSTKMNYP